MDSILVQTGEEAVTLSPQAVKRLLERGDGDGALLYLALLQRRGRVQPRALAGELRWDKERIEQAERTLRELGLLAPRETPPEPAEERPSYQREDIAQRLEQSGEFQELVKQVEQKLEKKLTTPDVGALLGLYDYVGLPADVIFLLVGHCDRRIKRKYGPGRCPTLHQIEKEGYAWARMGIDTQTAAAEYLKKYAQRQERLPAFMRVLQLGDRLPVASEEKYLTAWQEWGFPPETVAIAYDKTVFHCKDFKWSYCNGILRRWHEAGRHTPEEVEQEKRPQQQSKETAASDEVWKYVQELRRDRRE